MYLAHRPPWGRVAGHGGGDHRQSVCVGERPGVKRELCQFRVSSEFLEAKEGHGGS